MIRWLITAALLAACESGGGKTPAPTSAPAIDAAPSSIAATAYLALTDAPVAELPDLAYQPAHADADYVALEGTSIPLRFYIEPLNDNALASRLAAVRADFASVLGRTITDDEAARWQLDTLEDFRRRRVAARALLDLHLAGTLPLEQLQDRFTTLQSGIDLAFARITRITPDEHARLMAGP